MPKKLSPEIRQMKDRCVVDHDDFDWWLSQKGWSWQGLAEGVYPLNLDEAQLLYTWEDPVLWCGAYLDEPDNPGTPYRFFDYQIPSIHAWNRDVIHQDGAEVGKTREIIALTLWGMCSGFGFSIRMPSMLIGAPQQTHLDEIIMAVEEAVGVAEGLPGQQSILKQFWLKPKKQPHTMFRFLIVNPTTGKMGIGRAYFRPAGHDGVAFRGVHVNALGLVDEAAKMASETCWTEFFRALKPGCKFRAYSVPDGRRDTRFYDMSRKAVKNLAPDKKGMRLFNWPKTLMPDPFWNKDRERELADKYGGKSSPGYIRNVLGLHGDPQNTVWSIHTLMPNIRSVPEYRCIKCVCDENTDTLHLEAYGIELETMVNGNKVSHTQWLADRKLDLEDYTNNKDRDAVRQAVYDLLREFIEPIKGDVELWAGADLGINEPTEIYVYQRIGVELRHIARIHLQGANYTLQCEFIFNLDRLLDWKIAGWGVDLGSAGVSVVSDLQTLEVYEEGDYLERLQGFQFSEVVNAINEDGEEITKEYKDKEEPVRVPLKQLATELWTRRYQQHGAAIPYDMEITGHYMNHTATASSRSSDRLIYDKKDDHTIDAKRCVMLAKVFHEASGVDTFSSGVHERAA